MSTAEIESAIVCHEKVAEAACIGQADEDTGQSVAAFVTLEGDLEGTDELIAGAPRARRQAHRQAGAAQAHHLGRRPAQDALGQDHAPPAARHRRGPRARRRDDAARPGRHGSSSRARSRSARPRARIAPGQRSPARPRGLARGASPVPSGPAARRPSRCRSRPSGSPRPPRRRAARAPRLTAPPRLAPLHMALPSRAMRSSHLAPDRRPRAGPRRAGRRRGGALPRPRGRQRPRHGPGRPTTSSLATTWPSNSATAGPPRAIACARGCTATARAARSGRSGRRNRWDTVVSSSIWDLGRIGRIIYRWYVDGERVAAWSVRFGADGRVGPRRTGSGPGTSGRMSTFALAVRSARAHPVVPARRRGG